MKLVLWDIGSKQYVFTKSLPTPLHWTNEQTNTTIHSVMVYQVMLIVANILTRREKSTCSTCIGCRHGRVDFLHNVVKRISSLIIRLALFPRSLWRGLDNVGRCLLRLLFISDSNCCMYIRSISIGTTRLFFFSLILKIYFLKLMRPYICGNYIGIMVFEVRLHLK